MHKIIHMVVRVFETLLGVKKIHMLKGKTFTFLETSFASKTQLKNLEFLGRKLLQIHNPKQSLRLTSLDEDLLQILVTLLELSHQEHLGDFEGYFGRENKDENGEENGKEREAFGQQNQLRWRRKKEQKKMKMNPLLLLLFTPCDYINLM